MLVKMKLGTRIAFGFTSLLVLLVMMTVVAIYGLNMLNDKMEKIVNINDAKAGYAETMNKSVLEISRSLRALVLNIDQDLINTEKMNIENSYKVYDQAVNVIESLGLNEQEKASMVRTMENSSIARPLIAQVGELGITNNNVEATSFMMDNAAPAVKIWLQSIDGFEALQTELNQADAKIATQVHHSIFILLSILGGIAILLGIGVAFIIVRSITKPMNSAVARLSEGAQQVTAASNQLSASAQQLSLGSAIQASSIEETSSTLQESSSMLQQNTANTKQAAQLSELAKESANQGTREMQEMMDSIQEIKKSSNQIAKIIKVIDDIAFQTNILALNAAIEAARAGDAGMGFAVVAEEVRNLAQRSAQAVKDTTSIIETNIELSGKGVGVAERVREVLTEITTQSKKVSELMEEIAVASQEQAQGVDQVNKAMTQMETVIQQNAASAQESASAAEELSAQADSMRTVVHELAQLVDGKVAAVTQAEIAFTGHLNQSNQSNTAIGTDQALNQSKIDRRTKVISPEDIIPLEKDNKF